MDQSINTPPVVVSREEEILIMRLNRPDQRNAMNAALAQGISAAIDQLEGDPTLRAGILTGNGPGLCAGMDLKALLKGEKPITDRGWGGLVRKPPNKPLIVAIEGFAVAGGLELALSCDLIVAAKGAKLGIPEVQRGLVAAAGGLIRLPKRIPYHAAMYLAITGEAITAERAYELGLVNELCEPGGAFSAALRLAKRIAANAPLAVQASKAIVRDSVELDDAAAWELQDRVGLPVILESEDAKEGARSFAEKRQPVWKGR
ncbi:MAG: crotonase/enoyl-CoA hydratase family protein [Burkholderiales bacterium]